MRQPREDPAPRTSITDRRAGILRLVVREYVETAAPVGSKAIRDKYALPASPATIRHEMQALEQDGLLTHPHTSAGRVPSDRGYRFYVESLMRQAALPDAEQATIRHQFYQAQPEVDEWADLAAGLLARSLGLLALVAPPHAHELRVRQIELIRLNDLLALLVVVLHEARVLKQLVSLAAEVDQEALNLLAHQINDTVGGKSGREIAAVRAQATGDEQAVLASLERVLAGEAARELPARMEGLAGVLAQPEFLEDHARVIEIMSLVDRRATDHLVPPEILASPGVSVMIGSENQAEALHGCSVVVAPYGFRTGATGYVAVIGPTRMEYGRSVASVQFLGDLLNEMMVRVYG